MERGRARRLTLFLTFIGGILLLAFGSLHFPTTARAGNARHRPAIVPAGRPSARSPVLGMCAHPNWIISPILTPGITQDMRGVAATSPSDAWAVGDYDPSSGGATPLVEHFNGQA